MSALGFGGTIGTDARQIRPLVARQPDRGPAGLVSKHKSRPRNRRLDAGAADRALAIRFDGDLTGRQASRTLRLTATAFRIIREESLILDA